MAGVSDDHHALPTAMLRDLLRHRNFDVVDLGAHTPASSIIDRGVGPEIDDVEVAVPEEVAQHRRRQRVMVVGDAGEQDRSPRASALRQSGAGPGDHPECRRGKRRAWPGA